MFQVQISRVLFVTNFKSYVIINISYVNLLWSLSCVNFIKLLEVFKIPCFLGKEPSSLTLSVRDKTAPCKGRESSTFSWMKRKNKSVVMITKRFDFQKELWSNFRLIIHNELKEPNAVHKIITSVRIADHYLWKRGHHKRWLALRSKIAGESLYLTTRYPGL